MQHEPDDLTLPLTDDAAHAAVQRLYHATNRGLQVRVDDLRKQVAHLTRERDALAADGRHARIEYEYTVLDSTGRPNEHVAVSLHRPEPDEVGSIRQHDPDAHIGIRTVTYGWWYDDENHQHADSTQPTDGPWQAVADALTTLAAHHPLHITPDGTIEAPTDGETAVTYDPDGRRWVVRHPDDPDVPAGPQDRT